MHQLHTPGMVIGGMSDALFLSKSIQIQPNDKLYVFSDGVFEVFYPDTDKILTVEDFAEELLKEAPSNVSKVKSMMEFSQKIQNKNNFDDDFSIVEIIFRE